MYRPVRSQAEAFRFAIIGDLHMHLRTKQGGIEAEEVLVLQHG